jgi:hypothetical protein
MGLKSQAKLLFKSIDLEFRHVDSVIEELQSRAMASSVVRED